MFEILGAIAASVAASFFGWLLRRAQREIENLKIERLLVQCFADLDPLIEEGISEEDFDILTRQVVSVVANDADPELKKYLIPEIKHRFDISNLKRKQARYANYLKALQGER